MDVGGGGLEFGSSPVLLPSSRQTPSEIIIPAVRME